MIRFTFTYLKPIALLLSVVVLFQCCKVYDKQSVSIEQAINKDPKKAKRVKIEMDDGEKIVLDSIYYKDNELYGLLSKPKENSTSAKAMKVKEEIKIEEDKIVQIRPQNRAKSITVTVFIMAGSVFAGLIILFPILWNVTSEDNGN